MASRIGSFAWSEQTQGLLGRGEKLQVLAMLARSQAEQLFSRAALALGIGSHRLARVDMRRVALPDSAAARAAAREAETTYPPALLLHCLRSYAFGVLLGQFHGLRPDREKLYIASLFHDFGLVADQNSACRHCAFEVVGARRAYQFGADQGWTEAERRALYEAISRHINPHEPLPRSEPEAALLQRGATMDVIGSDRHRIPAEALRRVHADYPREGFREAILATMQDTLHPDSSRAGLLLSCGFVGMAARNPLDALPAAERARS